MQTGSSLYYHSHIHHNIDHVDLRTHKYIHHRKQFLKQYCSPLDDKISLLDKQIHFYQHLIQNQNHMIENQPHVLELKTQIQDFQQTQSFFLSHIEQYQTRILQLTVQNHVIQQQIAKTKHSLSQLTLQKTQQTYHELQSERKDQLHSKNIKTTRTPNTNLIASKTLAHSRLYPGNQHEALLPAIFKVEKYYASRQASKTGTLDDHKFLQADQTLNESEVHRLSQLQSHLKGQQKNMPTTKPLVTLPRAELQRKQFELRQKFKQQIASFNKFEILFKQCFEKKKSQIQKSVSHLQSKLISDREKFLQICEAIAQRDLKRVGFSEFESLTGDELMTLFISFPWILKKIFKELNHKRKLIVELQKNKFL